MRSPKAREALGRRLAESASQRRLLEVSPRRSGSTALPGRIEVYDNSHIQGTNAVGAMIVAGPEGFIKSAYRKFTITRRQAGARRGARPQPLDPEPRSARRRAADPRRSGRKAMGKLRRMQHVSRTRPSAAATITA